MRKEHFVLKYFRLKQPLSSPSFGQGQSYGALCGFDVGHEGEFSDFYFLVLGDGMTDGGADQGAGDDVGKMMVTSVDSFVADVRGEGHEW